MDFMKILISSIISSSIILGLMVMIIKKYITSAISFEFEKKIKEIENQNSRDSIKYNYYFEKQAGIYPEMITLTYRLKNILKEFEVKENGFDISVELTPLCALYTENLYKYRFYIPNKVFELMHEFKRIAQDAMIVRDVFTRDENKFDKEKFINSKKQIISKIQRAEELYKNINDMLKSHQGRI